MDYAGHIILWLAFLGTGAGLGFGMAWLIITAGGGKRM